MTTKTDTLTRWLPLFEKDESLRPEDLQRSMGAWKIVKFYLPDRFVAALIRDAAVRWLVERQCIEDAEVTVGKSEDGGWYVECETGDPMPEYDADTLDDALYEAVNAVMA